MRGILIIVLVGVAFKLFASGWIALTFLPIFGVWYCLKTAKADPVDEIFAGGFFLFVGVAAVMMVERLLS